MTTIATIDNGYMNAAQNQMDWVEKKTAELLAKAKRSGFFRDVIDDAKQFEQDGYVWDVALEIACRYWCS